MYNPVSTYRIQFHQGFTLKQLAAQKKYFTLLGPGTIYASPLLRAVPGSEHGYDVINPLEMNPETGSLQDFKSLTGEFHKAGIGWLQDIVPNHMAYHPGNAWLMDVLENGNRSPFHAVFDFEPGVPGPGNPLMVPFLGSSREEAIRNGEIRLGWENENFCIRYFDQVYPCNPVTFSSLLNDQAGTKQDKDLVKGILKKYNSDQRKLKEVLDKQHYTLCHWQETEKRINYRRFFTVNDLICLRMEDEEVFQSWHRLVAQLLHKGHISGFRIDHVDGLNDPNGYLQWLRKLSGNNAYIVTEKILEQDEDLPEFWPVQGSTGYDFLAMVNNLLTNVRRTASLKKLFRDVTNIKTPPAELIYQNKKMILTTRMHGEWDNIMAHFDRLGLMDYEKEGVTKEEMKEAIGEFMLACPVYRLYPRRFPIHKQNKKQVREIINSARQRNPGIVPALDILAGVLLSRERKDSESTGKVRAFFTRLMQFTGPLMAKGVEDTSMYQYNSFIAHNEVGDAINAKGISISEFHRQMSARQTGWPLTMNTTSTHDTKRGEDVRARLNVVSELTGEWESNIRRWMQMNQKMKIRVESGLLEPSLSVEYFIYQTLLGTFPFEGKANKEYLDRIDQYLVKALREAKRKVSWRDPDETYENAVCSFVRNMLDPGHEFLQAFLPFQQKVAWRGVVNSLTQLTLKCTCPGVPDIYQGTELWDLTLVDPDNRREVNYGERLRLLKEMQKEHQKGAAEMIRSLSRNPFDGKIKLWLTHSLLNLRKENPDLFEKGAYIPLKVEGKYRRHVLAFARQYEKHWLIVAVPLTTANLSEKQAGEYLSEVDWGTTRIVIPGKGQTSWKNLLTLGSRKFSGSIPVEEIFSDAPVGLMMKE